MAPKLCLGIIVISLSTVLLTSTHAGNILMVPLVGEGSHYTVMLSIARELTHRQHNVTMLVSRLHEHKLTTSTDSAKTDIHYVFFRSVLQEVAHQFLFVDMQKAGKHREWILDVIQGTESSQQKVQECNYLFQNIELLKTLQNSNYDLIIVDSYFNCPIVQYLSHTRTIPYIVVSAVPTISTVPSLVNRFPHYPSYMPELTSALSDQMSFFDRLTNVATSILFIVLFSLINSPYEEIRTRHDIISDTSAYYSDAELFLVNTHFVLDYPRPLLPNTIAVGGLTTRPNKTLHEEWIDFLESAGEDGVVLFSMGSYATGIDEDVAGLFAGAFAQLPQKVIWKLNGKPSASLTPNVKVVDWIPQNDLLGHPQIKAFVYHCGVNGVWEAVYHGVPMVAVPLFGDQYDNAQRLVSRGMAVKVDISTLTSDELAQAIRTVIKDPSYKNNATRISAIFRDSPRTPPEVAVDWIEYVIRHGGAKHLRSAALDLNIFQYLLLDVIAVLLLAFITLMIILYCSCRLCFRGCRRLCGGSSKVKSE